MIKALLIDDEALSLEALRLKIQACNFEISILKVFDSANEAILEIENLEPDVVFLDIEMPTMDGFAFLENFPNRNFEVIITTAHDEYAIQALRHSAVDFLLKPILISDLKLAIERLTLKIASKKSTKSTNFQKINAQFDKIPLPSLRGIVFVPLRSILYLESDGNYTTFYIEDGVKHVSSKNIGDFESFLATLGFFRIHHTHIINLIHIQEYLKGEGGSVVLSNGVELDVSKRKKKEFLDFMKF